VDASLRLSRKLRSAHAGPVRQLRGNLNRRTHLAVTLLPSSTLPAMVAKQINGIASCNAHAKHGGTNVWRELIEKKERSDLKAER